MKEINLKDIILGIEGLNIILKGNSLEDNIKQQGYNILIKGLPGTGKTTLGLTILDNFSRKSNSKVEVITMLEPCDHITRICDIFGLFEDTRGESRLVITSPDENLLDDLNFMVPKENIRYLMIDGISAIKYKFIERREILHRKIRTILEEAKRKGAFTIIVSEEPGETEDRFFEYIVDGVIHLSVEGEKRERYLEIDKLRWKDFYPGKHTFRLQSKDEFPNNHGVAIFPSIRCYFLSKPEKIKPDKILASGIPGLNKLIGGGFFQGAIILLMGEPGSGKTIFGMQFLKAIEKDSEGKGLYISLEHSYEEIKHTYSNLMPEEDKGYFLYINPATLSLDEFSSKIIPILKEHNINRLVVDSISSLKNTFVSTQEYTNYISSLIRVLKNYKVTSILIWEIPLYFQSPTRVEIYNSEDVDTIISLRQYDFNNSIFRGLVVLKLLGKEQNVTLQNMYITSEGLSLKERGWAKVGLLAGEPETISEAKLFFKFFYQSKAHYEIEESVFTEFSKRYPQEKFAQVLKTNPLPDHWSFKGYYGIGHSNTKVISIRKHIADILRKNGNLTDLPEDICNKYKERFESPLWKDIKDCKEAQMLPYYADIGVLVYQKEFLKGLRGAEDRYPKNWNEIIELKEEFVKFKKDGKLKEISYLFVIPNTVADTRQFMVFFLELLLAHGGRIWPFEKDWCEDLDECRDIFIKNVKTEEFVETLNFLKDLVGDGEAIPNPNIGGHYHNSIFSRRWRGKVEMFKEEVEMRKEEKKEKIEFSIAPLPEINHNRGSFSALDLYSLGIIRGALASETGWMFIDELLGFDVDVKRQCEKRRGLPIVRKEIYESKLLQDALYLDYNVVKSILFPDENKEGRKIDYFRTSDIPYYYHIEHLFAPIIKDIFEKDSEPKKIQENIISALISFQV